METSRMRYRFAVPSRPLFPGQEHEHLPLGLLQLKNKGNANRSDHEVHMAVSHFNATSTLTDLTSTASRFLYVGTMDRNITVDNYLDVHLCQFIPSSSATPHPF